LPPLPTITNNPTLTDPNKSQLPNSNIQTGKKPVFMDQAEEPKIPQPAQLSKKPKPAMDYDKLFGNVVDEGKSALAGAMSGEEKKPTDKVEPVKTTAE